MEAKEIERFVDSLFEEDIAILRRILELRKPKGVDEYAERSGNGAPVCPECGKPMTRNGKREGRGQKWICLEHKATATTSGGTPFCHSRLAPGVFLKLIAAEINGFTLRDAATICGVSAPTAFYVRQKFHAALSETLSSTALVGRVELDGKEFRINLKGTEPDKMPRKSKKRGSGSKETKHKVQAIFAIDENDSMVAIVTGNGAEDRAKADKMLPHLKGCKTLATDGKSCYIGLCEDNGMAHETVKSSTHSGERGETINEVNGMMSEFDLWYRKFRGVSVRHLQGYLDAFIFFKHLRYTKELLDRPGAAMEEFASSKVVITCKQILEKAIPIDLYDAYGDYHYGIFADK